MTIRRQPADFIVRERLSAPFRMAMRDPTQAPATSENTALHAVYVLSKASLATPEAIHHFARALSIRPDRVSYAGLKDKHARTTQHISVEPVPVGKPGIQRLPLASAVQGPTWEATLIGWSPLPVTAEAIDGNSFELVVRDLSRQAGDEMGRRADVLWTGPRPGEAARADAVAPTSAPDAAAAQSGILIVNYFGDQRFGGARHHQGWAGRALIDGDFESALRLAVGTPARKDSGKTRAFTRVAAARWGDWKTMVREMPMCPERRAFERLAAGGDFKQAFTALPAFTQQMAVEAYQSLLWNRVAALLVHRLAAGRSGEASPRDLLVTPDPFGDMLFPAPRRVDALWRGMILPLLSRKTQVRPEWGWAVERVLGEEGLTLERLRIPGLHRPFYGEAPRPLFVVAERFEMLRGERDEMDGRGVRLKRRVRFDLPRGAYATVVLRGLGQ
jgi:tRNA pseudouridine13 synthase